MAAREGQMTVGLLRLRGAEPDALAARLRMERLLGGVAPSLPGLPPSAIVCIRHLDDPRPGALSLRGHALRPPPAWELALQQALRERLAQAVRPALGAVPSSAGAVVFADPSELLACLARDVRGGLAGSRWWWRSLYGDVDLWARLVKECAWRAEYVPAALEALAARGEVTDFLRRLGDSEARALLVRVASRYGLRALGSALEERAGGEAREEAASAVGAPAPGSLEVTPEDSLGAPWEPRVPEVRSLPLGLEQRTLLGVALLLRRAPSEVARPGFASAVARWRRAGRCVSLEASRPSLREGPEVVATRAVRRSRPARASLPTGLHEDARPGDVEAPSFSRPAPEPGRPPSTEVVPEGPPTVPAEGPPLEVSAPALTAPPGEGSGAAEVWPGAPGPSADEAPSPAPAPAPSLYRADSEEGPAAPRWTGRPLRTSLGGLFYLLNLGLFLELYGDFSTPASPGIALPVWDFVSLLGRRLLGESRPEDPVWDVLARLAGREPTVPPGTGFAPPSEWRVPPSWLKPFREPGVWTWCVVSPGFDSGHEIPSPQPSPEGRGGIHRLRVLHPSGFLVVDVPCEEGDGEGLARLASEPYSQLVPFSLAPGSPPPPCEEASPLERWLGWLVPYVRARLQRALGLDDLAALPRVLLEHEALLHLTETHVGLVLSLADLPLPVRFAGLDRDIGWLPAAGRYVSFHFE